MGGGGVKPSVLFRGGGGGELSLHCMCVCMVPVDILTHTANQLEYKNLLRKMNMIAGSASYMADNHLLENGE